MCVMRFLTHVSFIEGVWCLDYETYRLSIMWVDMNVYVCCSVIVVGLCCISSALTHRCGGELCRGAQCHSTPLTMPFPDHFQLYVNYNCILDLIMFQVGVLPLLLMPIPGSVWLHVVFHTGPKLDSYVPYHDHDVFSKEGLNCVIQHGHTPVSVSDTSYP